jgi:murein DD-endopeptidase MepM/ murein hydrolase activator NlpD
MRRLPVFLLLAVPCAALRSGGDPAAALNALIVRITGREGVTTVTRAAFAAALESLRADPRARALHDRNDDPWTYPIAGYRPPPVDALRRAYLGARAYDFFDGNGHRGHPAFDLFVHDRDRDCRDDATGRAIPVVSVADGIVACVMPRWSPDSIDARGRCLRGGIVVWVYHPGAGLLTYYAHLHDARVHPGDRVRAGDMVGAVGRTGRYASARRSPTHLHFMCLAVTATGEPRPIDVSARLASSREAGVPAGSRSQPASIR